MTIKQAINELKDWQTAFSRMDKDMSYAIEALSMAIEALSAQQEIIRCEDCVYYDPPHVENNGVRSEYSEMPEDAFDVLGVGLVSVEYGINIGGRCCRDYNVSYSEDKRVFIPETNYCGRAERRTDEQTD